MTKIKTRKDLTNYFQLCLSKNPKNELQDTEEEELPSKSLRSYIIESNTSLESISPDNFEIKISSTKDDTLKILDVKDKNNNKIKFYVDLIDNRFFVFHSFGEKNIIEGFMNDLINRKGGNFDYPWFFNKFMDKVSSLGANDSFTVKFRNEFLLSDKEISDIGKFSMRFWGNSGRERLNEIREKTSLKTGTSLSNVGIKVGGKYSFIKDNISFIGSLTAIQGNSIGEHFFIVNKIKSMYSQIINKIESHSISYDFSGNKIKIKGEPILIEFEKEIENLDFFIKTLVSSKNPFRIWGLPEVIDDDYISVKGIDLHTGDKINFEVSPNWMRIYLPKGSCGNIIARLLTNIQHYFDSNAKLIISGEEIE